MGREARPEPQHYLKFGHFLFAPMILEIPKRLFSFSWQ
jgi:hypothetical protein